MMAQRLSNLLILMMTCGLIASLILLVIAVASILTVLVTLLAH